MPFSIAAAKPNGPPLTTATIGGQIASVAVKPRRGSLVVVPSVDVAVNVSNEVAVNVKEPLSVVVVKKPKASAKATETSSAETPVPITPKPQVPQSLVLTNPIAPQALRLGITNSGRRGTGRGGRGGRGKRGGRWTTSPLQPIEEKNDEEVIQPPDSSPRTLPRIGNVSMAKNARMNYENVPKINDEDDAQKPNGKGKNDDAPKPNGKNEEDDDDANKPNGKNEDDEDDANKPNGKNEDDDTKKPNGKNEDDDTKKSNGKNNDDDDDVLKRPDRSDHVRVATALTHTDWAVEKGLNPWYSSRKAMIFDGKLEGKPLSVKLDSGAEISVVSQKFTKKNKLTLHKGPQQALVAYDGRASEVYDQYVSGTLVIQDFHVSATFIVVELSENLDMILGNNIACRFGITQRWHEGKAYARGVSLGTAKPQVLPQSHLPQDSVDDAPIDAHSKDENTAPLLKASALAGMEVISMRMAKRMLKAGDAQHYALLTLQRVWGEEENSNNEEDDSVGEDMLSRPTHVDVVTTTSETAAVAATATDTSYGIKAQTHQLPQQHPYFVDMQKYLEENYPEVLNETPELPPTRGSYDFAIELKPGAEPSRSRYNRMSVQEEIELKKVVNKLLKLNYIRPSTGPYGSAVMFIKKKDGSLRLVVDYRQLNAQTVMDSYPLPHIDDLLKNLYNKKFFTLLDLRSGFNQVRVRESDVEKTAFRTRFGTFALQCYAFWREEWPPSFLQTDQPRV